MIRKAEALDTEVVVQVNRWAHIPQIILLALFSGLVWLVAPVHWLAALMCGLFLWMLYGRLVQIFIMSRHRTGMALLRQERFSEAISCFQSSYDFFTRHRWIERYRYITTFSISATTFREMALVNIAYAFIRLNDEETARGYYQRTLQEFPESTLVPRALELLEAEHNTIGENGTDGVKRAP
jgi:tetratricopeptide (TPR) repeat protein